MRKLVLAKQIVTAKDLNIPENTFRIHLFFFLKVLKQLAWEPIKLKTPDST